MSRLSVEQLPWPADRFRVDLLNPEFETEAFCIGEDSKRARLARKSGSEHGGDWGQRVVELADRIDPAVSPHTPRTLASSRAFRHHRITFTGALLRATDSDRTGQIVRADVVKPSQACDLAELLDQQTRLLKNEFRQDLLRAGAANSKKGFLAAVLHSEFDPIAQLFQPHWHIEATGDYVDAVEGLRSARQYQPTDRVRTPVRVTHSLTNLPHALSYLLKGYWPARPLLPLGSNGSLKRPRERQRIKEPYHSQVLMWFDQQVLSDLVLLMGAEIRRSGIELK